MLEEMSQNIQVVGSIKVLSNKVDTEEFCGNKPILLSKFASSWPAFGKWSLEWFLEHHGNKTVGINTGRYVQSSRYKTLAYSHDKTDKPLRDYISAITQGKENPGYVAAHTFTNGFEELENEVDLPSKAPRKDLESRHFWISAQGTITQLHFDRAHNILVQIFGTKRISLYSPKRSSELAPLRVIGNWAVDVSQLEIDKPIDDSNLPSPDYIVELNPGDAIFLPYGWWHKVTSIGNSISVNHWWWNKRLLATRLPDLVFVKTKIGIEMAKSNLGF